MSSHISITSAGITVPQASEIKTAFQGVFTDAMGSDLNLDDSTPQGVAIDDLTDEKMADNAEILYLFNQFNPETNDGVFQDAIANLFGLKRKVATSSVVNCVCIGVPGTILNGIDSGEPAKVISTNGDVFQCVSGGTIPAGGSITLQFSSEETGPIPCPANTLNSIFTSVAGWDSVNNTSSGTPGEDEESRFDFEERRKKTLALNATGSLSSVYSHISALDGVTDLMVWENDSSTNKTYNGVSMTPHSIYICQSAATITSGNAGSGSLAEAIYLSKSAGCDTVGSNTCTYTDTVTGVQYTYNYDTPTSSDVYFKVTVSDSISQANQDKIKQAIVDEFNGDLQDPKITIGSTIYASKFLSAISNLNLSGVILEAVTISKTSGSGYTNVLTYNMNILPTISTSNITFEVNS